MTDEIGEGQDMVASAPQTGLSSSTEPCGLGPSGFDPLRISSPWKSIATAPLDGTVVFVRTTEGVSFRAKFVDSGFLDGSGEDCGSWVAAEEGIHPDDWHDGACWESNMDDNPSTAPVQWMEDTGAGRQASPTPHQDNPHDQ